MPLYDSDGNEVENALTAEEAEIKAEEIRVQAREEAVEDYKRDNPDNSEELEKLEAELTDAQDELSKLNDKDLNFEALRRKKESAEETADRLKNEKSLEIEELRKEMDEKITGVKKTYDDSKKEQIISSMARGDDELAKKISHHFDRIADTADTPEALAKKVTDAYILATGGTNQNALNAALTSAGLGSPPLENEGDGGKDFTPEMRGLAKKLGLNDADIEKHGGKETSNTP